MPAHKQGATKVFQAAVELAFLASWVIYVWNYLLHAILLTEMHMFWLLGAKCLALLLLCSTSAVPPSHKTKAKQFGFQPCGTKCHNMSCHLLPRADTVLPARAMQAHLGPESKPRENGCWDSWSGHPARRALVKAEPTPRSRAAWAEQLQSTVASFRPMVLQWERAGSWGFVGLQPWEGMAPQPASSRS